LCVQVCLEEGMADDDSWVEEGSESSSLGEASLEIEEEVIYQDREEELRGYHRTIDFTLHTILEESCEESDVDEEERTKRKKREKERESR
jgi:synaptotagmin-like protein